MQPPLLLCIALCVTLAHSESEIIGASAVVPEVEGDFLVQQFSSEAAGNVTEAANTPNSTVAHQERIAEAAGSSHTNAIAAAAAKIEEDKLAAEQAAYAKKAKELNGKQRELQLKATADNQNLVSQFESDQASSAAKMKAANDASAQAEEANRALQHLYNSEHANQTHAHMVAAQAAAATREKTQQEIEENNEHIATEKATIAKLAADQEAAAEALQQAQAAIVHKFNATSARLAAENRNASDTLKAEEAAAQKRFADEFVTNGQKEAETEAAITAQEEMNAEEAAADKAALDKRYAEKEQAQEAAHKAWQTAAELKAAARDATDEISQKRVLDMAQKAEDTYQAQMANASSLQAAADSAHEDYNSAMGAYKQQQHNMDVDAVRQLNEDAEIVACAIDGSECLGEDGKCQKIGDDAAPFMGADLVTCSDTKPEDEAFGGLKWAGVSAPDTIAKDVPSPECIKSQATFAEKFGSFESEPPIIDMACKEGQGEVTEANRKEALTAYFSMMADCPEYCLPGSATFIDGVQTTKGDCIDGDTMAKLGENVKDTPEYKASGTSGKIPAGESTKMCVMVKSILEGITNALKDEPKN